MSKKKILIFDDETSILEVIFIVLNDLGYEVEVSETADDIIQKVSDFQPDVIIMDNWIPVIGGVEATKLLKAHPDYKSIPVIYITANNDIASLANEAKADDYVPKPFDLEDLEKKVLKWIHHKISS
ncbi:response regulator [Epilithonimonas hungarica]|uniref:Response regulator receiver domain-containing protein n=1 Tax=Epilithonimonas hungarica TaxID=454006 RepID=A0A1G7SF07_9FLAO|nr:response regulator [Epilithonimonas hungarica]MDP9955815.1 CheY-like chemotaxis protein [Epilithonimonas hungarica]SDG21583.1 Response regulator receiver domain-containing protein [Epilithonimonas hungarica]